MDLIPVRFMICRPDFAVVEGSLGLAKSDGLIPVEPCHPWPRVTHMYGRSQCRLATDDEYEYEGRIAYRIDSFGATCPISETIHEPVTVGMPSPDPRAPFEERLEWASERFADLCEFRLENGAEVGWHCYQLLTSWGRAGSPDERRQCLQLSRMFGSVLLDAY
jgi:hypothetical protein